MPRQREYKELVSEPAPLGYDSDPDFNPGPVDLPEAKKKRGRKSASDTQTQSSVRKGRKRRSDVLDGVTSSSRRRRLSRPYDKKRDLDPAHNRLLQYFETDLGLQSASEEEDADDLQFGDSHLTDGKGSEDGSGDSADHDANPTDSTFMKPSRRTLTKPKAPDEYEPAAESVTEPESEDEVVPLQVLKRRSPFPPNDLVANKRAKFTHVENDTSVTESESDAEMPLTRAPANASANSATESESEVEDVVDLTPRPQFISNADQPPVGPLLLDSSHGIQVPGSINTFLREYQREGVKFFWRQYNQGRGGILGDDMGLGKTVQVISFLSAVMKKHGDARDEHRRRNHVSKLQDGREWRAHRTLPPANATWPTCLIIAPATVVLNWEREFQTWGYFEVAVYRDKDKDAVLRDFTKGRLDVVLTSFETARDEIDFLDELPWSCVIVDEVHRLKSSESKTTQNLNRFRCLRRFGLTGTAIQNSYGELWTVLDWANPGMVGTKRQWRGFISQPLQNGQSASASEDERVKAHEVSMALTDKLLPQMFIRRTKDIIQSQLPQKLDQVVFCPLTETQRMAYKRILNMREIKDWLEKDDPCDCGSGEKSKSCCHEPEKGSILKYMSILLKISNHLALILPTPNDDPEQAARNRALAAVAFPNQPLPKYGPAMLENEFCGKWKALEELLSGWHKDPTNKVLIFTKSVKLLGMLEFHLQEENYGFLKLDGSTKNSERMPVIDKFHRDPDVFIFLISTLAGGTGLNLVGANKVVIFDPNWNPAHDLQAMDRAYRLGQTRDVEIFRLLGAGSIEELIYARQLYKQQQMRIGYEASVQTRYFQGVQGDVTRQGELFGIKNIFTLHEDTLATKKAIERAAISELDWALANKKADCHAETRNKWVYENEKTARRDNTELKGLGALLFDDDLSPENDIRKFMAGTGVNYMHRNDEMLAPSKVEAERIASLARKKVAERKGRKSAPATDIPEFEWPPRRSHHNHSERVAKSAESLLDSRREALIELGYIHSPAHLPEFARSFLKKSSQDQAKLLAKLDNHVATREDW